MPLARLPPSLHGNGSGREAGLVLCAFDASEPSLLASSRVAAWVAGALGAPLELVYVVNDDAPPALPRTGAAAVPQVREALHEIHERVAEDAARAELDAMRAVLP